MWFNFVWPRCSFRKRNITLLLLLLLLCYPKRCEPDKQSKDVRQHVIGVSNQSQRVGDVTEDDFSEEEQERETQHRHHSTRLRLVPSQYVVRCHCDEL